MRDEPVRLEFGFVATGRRVVPALLPVRTVPVRAVPVLTVPVLVVPAREPVTMRPLASRLTPLRVDVDTRPVPAVEVRRLAVPTRVLKRPRFSERTEEPVGRIAYRLPE